MTLTLRSINDLLETYKAQFYLKYGTQKSTIANSDAKKVKTKTAMGKVWS